MAGQSITVKITGLEEINRRLMKLADRSSRNALVAAMRKSLVDALNDAKARAPVSHQFPRVVRGINHPGYLKEQFDIVKMPSFTADVLEVRLVNKAYYALWVEYGHKLVVGGRAGRGGKVVGFVGPHPFMRPVYDAHKQRIIANMQGAVEAELLKRGV